MWTRRRFGDDWTCPRRTPDSQARPPTSRPPLAGVNVRLDDAVSVPRRPSTCAAGSPYAIPRSMDAWSTGRFLAPSPYRDSTEGRARWSGSWSAPGRQAEGHQAGGVSSGTLRAVLPLRAKGRCRRWTGAVVPRRPEFRARAVQAAILVSAPGRIRTCAPGSGGRRSIP